MLSTVRDYLEDSPTLIFWVKSLIEGALGEDAPLLHNRWAVDSPTRADHGDVASNIGLIGGKILQKKPQDFGNFLVEKLKDHPLITDVWCAGAGFLNIRFSPVVWLYYLEQAVLLKSAYGRLNVGKGKKVHIEFVSTNPTGPLHIGHLRGAVLGDVLARLLEKVGYKPWREYYVNDAGAQIEALQKSVYTRYLQALGEKGGVENIAYPGDYLRAVGESLAHTYGSDLREKGEEERAELIKAIALKAMLETIKRDLEDLDIRFDNFFSEKKLIEDKLVEKVFLLLQEKGLIYQGILDIPKGKCVEDWEPREQTLFRATQFGDDSDRPLKKSDGSWTYFATDVAYHYDKFQRGFTHMINVFGADHGGYIKRLQAACSALSDGQIDLDIKICQLVRLSHEGKSVRMSKRAGNFVMLKDVVEDVGADCVRFMMLSKKNDAPLDFDFAKAKEQSKDNWVFYVQYAHARICSVFRCAQQEGFDCSEDNLSEEVCTLLTDEKEREIMKKISFYSTHLLSAAQAHEPHRVVFYLHDLASSFHELWHKGKEASHLRFILKNNAPLTQARLFLLQALRNTLASGLMILGILPLEEMN